MYQFSLFNTYVTSMHNLYSLETKALKLLIACCIAGMFTTDPCLLLSDCIKHEYVGYVSNPLRPSCY